MTQATCNGIIHTYTETLKGPIYAPVSFLSLISKIVWGQVQSLPLKISYTNNINKHLAGQIGEF